ncbi:MAG: hypothetical protein IT379_39960 [Deltaproteobacteria bacterium]|nr:hypothetical protein [Deltaproteobacteria bacterium]
MNVRWTYLVASSLVLLGSSCTGTEGGNPAVPAHLALSAYSTDATRVSLGEGGSHAAVTDAWAVVRDLKLERADRCDEGTAEKVVFDGAFAARLTTDPAVREFDADPQPYCRLTMKIDDTTDVDLRDAPAELSLHSVLVRGTRSTDGAPFLLRSRQKLDIELRSRGDAFVVDPDAPSLLLGFDLVTWLGMLDLESADLEPDGSLLIDADHNRDLLDVFDDQLVLALRLFHDRDGDRSVSDEEASTPLAE